MKNLIFILCITFSSVLSANNVENDTYLDSPDRRIEVNMTITASNGCEFQVSGWVDVSISWGLEVTVNGYDVTASGPCGTFTFTQEIERQAPDNPEIDIRQEEIEGFITGLIDDRT
jgi:hypothetical protein